MPRDKEYIDIVEKGNVVASVRCYKVTKMFQWSFSTHMVNFGYGWHKLTRDRFVGQPRNGTTWKFPDGV